MLNSVSERTPPDCVVSICCVGFASLYVISFCLPHPVAVSAFMICRGLCVF